MFTRVRLSPVSVTVDDVVTPSWFPCYLAPPVSTPVVATDESRRDLPPCLLKFPTAPYAVADIVPLRPGELVQVESTSSTYETVGAPRELRSGRRVVGNEVAVISLDDLYPFSGDLLDQSGASLSTSQIPLSARATTDVPSSRGVYEDLQLEAPAYTFPLLQPNRALDIDGVRHQITRVTLPPNVPVVRLTVRRKDVRG